MKNNKLGRFRKEIDSIDSKIISLLSKRMQLSKKIGNHKKKNNLKIYCKDREQQVIKNLRLKTKSTLEKELITTIYNKIFNYSRKAQSTKTKN